MAFSRTLPACGGDRLAAALRQRLPAALIDEFQDTDPVQYRIFRRIYHERTGDGPARSLFLIGDPKQAIYGFRGADLFTYLSAVADAGDRCYTLGVNWRSAPPLIDAVNQLFTRPTAPFVYDRIRYLPVEAAPHAVDTVRWPDGAPEGPLRTPLEILHVPSPDGRPLASSRLGPRLPGAIAAEIARLLDEGASLDRRPLGAGDLAVLVRTNRQAVDMQRALRHIGVPSVLHSETNVFDTVEAEELETILQAVAEPASASRVRLALATEPFGVTAGELLAFQEDETGWETWLARFQRWSERWRSRGFVAMVQTLLGELAVESRLLRRVGGERQVTNLRHLIELLQAATTNEHLGPAALVRWLAEQRDGRRAAPEAAQQRLESDAAAVQVVTVHKAKGLEYEIVYCPYLWESAALREEDAKTPRFHDAAAGDRLTLDLGSPERDRHTALAQREAHAEATRLLYVALTRARQRCAVVWGNFRARAQAPLGHLLHPAPSPSSDSGGALEATASHLESLGEETLRAELAALAASSGGAIGLRELSFGPVPRYRAPRPDIPALAERRSERSLPRSWRIASFSSLAAGSHVPTEDADEGIDRDAAPSPSPTPTSSGEEERVRLHAFPAGTSAGNFFHRLLEHIDFARVEEAATGQRVADELAAHGYDVSTWQDPVWRALVDLTATPLTLDPEPLTLQDVSRAARLDELPFVFPVATGGGPALTPRRLAAALAPFAPDELPASYVSSLGALSFAALTGYLKGFVDLVFRHERRWYVVDYKSNFLGERPADYHAERLPAAMAHSHYFLQYLIYVVALHRYLRLRDAAYDYERDMGGVFYLFLKGMAPSTGAEHGVFRHRPSAALIAALSAFFDGPQEEQP